MDARYYVPDHLGSTRAVLDTTGVVRWRADYLPYGRYVSVAGSSATPTTEYMWTGKEKQAETILSGDWYDSSARYLGTQGQIMSIDPQSEKYPGISPYAYCAGDPVNAVDPEGTMMSTHTDQTGKVVAVFDDGDLGVYKHSGVGDEVEQEVMSSLSSTNTAAGGEWMGESLQTFSFATSTATRNGVAVADKSITIDFGSTQLTNAGQGIIDANPTIIEYAVTAKLNGDWDIKNQAKYRGKGSLLFGKYASPRDAGNFMAGYFSASKGVLSPIIDFGYGFYNLSGNNKIRTMINAGLFMMTPLPTMYKAAACDMIRLYGEDKISKISQSEGNKFYKKMK